MIQAEKIEIYEKEFVKFKKITNIKRIKLYGNAFLGLRNSFLQYARDEKTTLDNKNFVHFIERVLKANFTFVTYSTFSKNKAYCRRKILTLINLCHVSQCDYQAAA